MGHLRVETDTNPTCSHLGVLTPQIFSFRPETRCPAAARGEAAAWLRALRQLQLPATRLHRVASNSQPQPHAMGKASALFACGCEALSLKGEVK